MFTIKKESYAIDCAAAALSAADATLVVGVQRGLVVNRDLFPGFDISQCDEQDVPAKNLHERVRHARVIYVVSTVTTATPIQTPTAIHFTDAEHLSMRSAAGLSVRDFFSSVLRNLPPLPERDGCEASFAVNARRFDGQAGG